MDTTTVAIVASGIGAAGAVAGQLVSQTFTGRREAKRLKWEGEQRAWERQQAIEAARFERARVFADVKRASYAEYLRAIGERRMRLYRVTGGNAVLRATVREELKADWVAWWNSFQPMGDELTMLSAEVGNQSRAVRDALLALERAAHQADIQGADELVEEVDKKVRDLLTVMRSDLNLENLPNLPASGTFSSGASA
ncbi:hypothetical protein AB0P21_10095 [Kribbella sp. NPDC056861]|uniref:hypothetical protein n=1 Tax=Kribbella sp. NPDC056861 TaxID=3154857 RepID=UPI00344667AB